MNPKYDVEREDLDDDFEATHRDLAAYVRGDEQRNAGLERLRWERKMMSVVKKLLKRVSDLEDGQHNTAEIAIIAQREIGPARKFVEAVIHWRRQIIKWAATAAVTGLVAWFLAQHGFKAT